MSENSIPRAHFENSEVRADVALRAWHAIIRNSLPAFGDAPPFRDLVDAVTAYLPDDHQERIDFLRSVARELKEMADQDSLYLNRSGRIRVRAQAGLFSGAANVLDRCGENPIGTFTDLTQRLENMPEDRRQRYIDGLLTARTLRGDGWDLLQQILKRRDTRSHPFYSWTDREWEALQSLPQRAPLPDRLQWNGTQGDLVVIMDALKQAGLLDEETTDADVIRHFDYGSAATDPTATYRKTRDKLNKGETHPSGKVAKVIEILQKK